AEGRGDGAFREDRPERLRCSGTPQVIEHSESGHDGFSVRSDGPGPPAVPLRRTFEYPLRQVLRGAGSTSARRRTPHPDAGDVRVVQGLVSDRSGRGGDGPASGRSGPSRALTEASPAPRRQSEK